jgi:alpha-tubulin suppressor-like RCC1 family protein
LNNALSHATGVIDQVVPSGRPNSGTSYSATPLPVYTQVPSGPQEAQLATVKKLAMSGNAACVVLANESLSCWGYNELGLIGNGKLETTSYRAQPATALTFKNTAIGAGRFVMGALDLNGGVWAWGASSLGVLGTGTTDGTVNPNGVPARPVAAPVAFPNDAAKVAQVAFGDALAVSILRDGRVFAWVTNNRGEAGRDPNPSSGEKSSTCTLTPGKPDYCEPKPREIAWPILAP